MITDHPFKQAWPARQRCGHLVMVDTVCGRSRAEHTASRATRVSIPREKDVYSATTNVAGLDVAITDVGLLLLRTGKRTAFVVDNLDALIAHLELARGHEKRRALHPQFYRPGVPPVDGFGAASVPGAD